MKREIVYAALRGAPWGVAGVYLLFLLGGMVAYPAPSGVSVPVVSAALAERWGNPVTAALVQTVWSALLGAVLGTAGLPFRLERRTLLFSGLHFLLTAAVLSLAGWQCRWFPYRESWLCVLGIVLLCYVLMWAVRWIGWRQDLRVLRRAAGLPDGQSVLPWFLLAAGVELILPWGLRLVDARDFPVLTGVFYPFLVLPVFCLVCGASLGKRQRWPWVLGFALWCGVLTVPNVFLLYNYTALFHVWVAGIAALLGGCAGLLPKILRKK